MFVARFQQRTLREYLNGTSNRPPGRHRIQNAEGPVLDPCAKQINFRRDPKVDPLRIESGPSWRACFWSLHFLRCAEVLQAAMCAECQAWSYWHKQHPRQDSWTGEARICVSNFSYLLGPKNRPFGVTGRSKSHPNDHLLDSWAGTSARDRPDIPPAPQNKDLKTQASAKWRHFYEAASCYSQNLCVQMLHRPIPTLLNHCVEGVRGNVPKFGHFRHFWPIWPFLAHLGNFGQIWQN